MSQQAPPYYLSTAIIIIVINIISFLCLSFVIFIHLLKWSKISSFPLRLSFYLCISCIIQNLSVLITVPMLVNQYQLDNSPNQPYCKFDGILKTTADLSSIIWTTLIIYSVYATIVRNKNIQKLEILYVIFGYAFPLIVSIIPVFWNLYGADGYWCWFRDSQNRNIEFALKIIYFFGPLWIVFILNLYMSVKCYDTLKQLGMNQRQLMIFKRLMLFPFIMFATQFLQTIDLIVQFCINTDPQWLDIIGNLLSSSYGIANAIAYGLNPVIRQQIQLLFGIKQQINDRQRQISNISNLMTQRSQQSNRDKRYTNISDY